MAKGSGRLIQAQKAAKQQQRQQHSSKRQKISSSPHSARPKNKKQAPQTKAHTIPTIPFSPSHAILLVGEGDVSFAASLATHHRCTNLTATVFEKDHAALLAKYPHAGANLAALESQPGCRILYGIDARKMAPFMASLPPLKKNGSDKEKKVRDRERKKVGAMDRILFNFPHVGGKSTDVNRQVRFNQELLVDFFRCALRCLAPRGKVVVTLFEGEPYTLWNIRDLARHAGLAVERSFVFRAEAYPGYRHARTLGIVKKKDGGASETGWRGEERMARSYVFVRKGEEAAVGQKRKRKKGSVESDSSESESGGGGNDSEEEQDAGNGNDSEDAQWEGVSDDEDEEKGGSGQDEGDPRKRGEDANEGEESEQEDDGKYD